MEKGYYTTTNTTLVDIIQVAIHNKNGKGLLHPTFIRTLITDESQSTIKMEKGYYRTGFDGGTKMSITSQSTIKMEKGYYFGEFCLAEGGKLSQSTIKMEKGYY